MSTQHAVSASAMHARWPRRLSVVAMGALVASITMQIAYPLVHGAPQDAITVAILCTGAVAMAADAVRRAGLTRGAVIIASIASVAFAAEVIGTRTGFPFGGYSYTQGRIGPSIATVPIMVTAAWFVGAYSVWRVASFVVRRGAGKRVCLATIALVGWDLYLDPQMVAAGLWRWDAVDAGLPGIEQIPLTNYAGWALIGVVVFGMLTILDPPRPVPAGFSWRSTVPSVPLVWFIWTWVGSAVAQTWFLSDGELRPGVAYALVAMAVLGVPGIAKATRCRRREPRPGTMSTCWRKDPRRTDDPDQVGRCASCWPR